MSETKQATKQSLEVCGLDGKILFHLTMHDGEGATIIACDERHRNAVERWAREGLEEVIRSGDETMLRRTPPTSFAFLANLAAYIARQFPHIDVSLRIENFDEPANETAEQRAERSICEWRAFMFGPESNAPTLVTETVEHPASTSDLRLFD